MRSSDVTNRDLLAGSAYGDDRHLAARQAIYHWQTPRYDLPGIVAVELAGTAGVVVDVGCGNGTFLRRLHTERPDLYTIGMDISAGILRDVPPPVVVADAAHLPLGDDTADAVLAMHMLYPSRTSTSP
jgi:ubiquinone/menaquinone biosynthesis C-methylase UbiE